MEQKNTMQHKMLSRLSSLPKKMLQVYERDNMTEFVLHELAHPHCYDLSVAAYFVDNPDFDCFKGIAGVVRDESFAQENPWNLPDDFSHHMNTAAFNQKVRLVQRPSYRRQGMSDEQIVKTVAKDLALPSPYYYTWDMKHGNHGIVIYHRVNNTPVDTELAHGLCVLGFCPLF